MKILLRYKYVEGGFIAKGDWGHATILKMLMNLFIIEKGALSYLILWFLYFKMCSI